MLPRSLAAALLLLAACDGGEHRSEPGAAATVGVPLAERPPLPVIVTRYEAAMAGLRAAVATRVGTGGWQRRPASVPTALCQDFGTEPDTGIRSLDFLVHDRFVPEPAWRDVLAVVRKVGREHGFTELVRVVDRSDEHRVELFDRYGATLSVQDGPRVLSFGLITGCHLRQG